MFTETVQIPLPGLSRTYTFVHITDIHTATCTEDSPEEERLAAERGTKGWTPASGILPLDSFQAILKEAAKEPLDALFVTGDAVDRPFPANAAYLAKTFSEFPHKVMYAIGNHECAESDHNTDFYAQFAPLMDGSPAFHVLDLGELLVAAMDDSDQNVTTEQLDRLKALAKRNLPILLLVHIPLITPSIEPGIMKRWGPGFMIGTADDADTAKAFVSYVKSEESHIAAIFCGHIHYAHTGEFAPGRLQFAAAPAFDGFARKIELVPAKN